MTGIPTYTEGQILAKGARWGLSKMNGQAVLRKRADIKVGDIVHSSHYGQRKVAEVHHHGTEGQTTELVFDLGAMKKNERYPSDSLIPLYVPWDVDRAVYAEVRRLRELLDAHHEGFVPIMGCTHCIKHQGHTEPRSTQDDG